MVPRPIPASRTWTSLIAGAVVVGLMELPSILSSEDEDFGPTLIGLALLLLPYGLYGMAGRGLRPLTWTILLALLLLSTTLGLLASASSSTGGLIFLWLLPAQCAISWLATLLRPGVFRKH